MSRWLPKSLFYKDRRPTRFAKLLNRSWARIYSLGILPSSLVGLETRGRRSGLVHSTAVVVADYGDERYLVSMLGESVDWVRNVRAANGEAVLRHGRRERVRLKEVPVAERAPVLRAYYKRAQGARWHFDVTDPSSIEEFEKTAELYPVFRIVPVDD